MIEVETKVKVSSLKLPNLKKKILAISNYLGSEKKHDDYYTLLPLKSYPKKSLRIRHRSDFYEVNFKKSISWKKGIHAKNEVEFHVSDIKNFLSLINDFGFKKWLTKKKTTYLYKIKKNFHIELNYLSGLGWFIEIEYLSEPDKKSIEKARSEVFTVLKKLGFTEKDTIKSGYTKLLWDKKKN